LINIIQCDDGDQSNEGPLNSAERRHMDSAMTMNSPTLTSDQAKQRAYAIKERMTQLGNPISMTQAYEILATSSGYRNWPTMKGSLETGKSVQVPPSTPWGGEPQPPSLSELIESIREQPHQVERTYKAIRSEFPVSIERISRLAASIHPVADGFFRQTGNRDAGNSKGGSPFQADKLIKDAGLELLQIFQICNGDYSDHHDIEWSHQEDEKRFDAITSHAINLKAILSKLDMPVFQPRRWHHVRTPPPAGGTYVVGGYLQHGSMPRHFEWAFASVALTVNGPEWRHRDERHKHVPIEYWTELGSHPEHSKPDPRGIVFIDRDELLDIYNDLETVRKAVFGDVGDEPDVYADYDELSRLAGSMRKAISKLHRRTFEPGTTV
jgi:hypothetical protein